MLEFGVVSHLTAALVYIMLAGMTARHYLRRNTDRALFAAALLSTLWSLLLVAQQLSGWPSFTFRFLAELIRDGAWVLVLLALIMDSRQGEHTAARLKWLLGGTIGLILLLLAVATLTQHLADITVLDSRAVLLGQLTIALLAISLIEQIWRNSSIYGRSSIRYLCFGIGGIFLFDFFLYADALLFRQLSPALWDARGGVNALMAPLLAVNLINARKQPLQLQLSRTMVFHAGSLVLAGLYLLVIAGGGYYVRLAGGTWGEGLQVLFLATFVLLFVLVMSSNRFRARLMVFISKNFFDYKYDYREEWLKMTEAFSNLQQPPPLPERAIRVLADLVESRSGALWLRNDDGHFDLEATLVSPVQKQSRIDRNSELVSFLHEREWILDLREYQHDPVRYNLLEMPDSILQFRQGWLVIPLYLGRQLYGIALIGSPYTQLNLNWENYDLIKVVARQLCNFLAQANTQDRLSRAMQFEAVSKASAFMVHDLKTLIAQLSLLVKNAPRHRNNPAFIDDMIRTTAHSITKMSNLVEHIRRPATEDLREPVDLAQLTQAVVAELSRQLPRPFYHGPKAGAWVLGDSEQLQSVLGHLVRNAQDATGKEGEVAVTLKISRQFTALFIQDTGIGMSEEFIHQRLFKPFESTKGLTGMGIGAYQAQEYIKRLDGTLEVTSEQNVGSCFTVRLPSYTPELAKTENTHQE
ncbi:MAG: PEP-CTERM system histidine kinase PrsK [Halomonadaceae bacterium]|nr:MAG: PEP-CTERM system histidine kinase PrsK [Halomonadaceae bacterium]